MLNLTLLNSILFVPDRGFNIVKPMLNLTMLNFSFSFFFFVFCFYIFNPFSKTKYIFTLCLYIFSFLNFSFMFVKNQIGNSEK